MDRIEKLRQSKEKDKLLPNLKDRMDAAYLIDKVECDVAISIPNTDVKQKSKPIQKSDKMCI